MDPGLDPFPLWLNLRSQGEINLAFKRIYSSG